jgi:hypothetical protein
LMCRGLLFSYSRGAWVATVCGLGYLGCQGFKPRASGARLWIRSNALALALIVCSVAVLALWELRQTEWRPARRALSVANVNDFSWRNRLAAWEGTLQMMTDRPWFGFGWNQPEPMYHHYYRPVKVSESMAVQMNDFLVLGATLGLPALFCFAAFLWLSLTCSGRGLPSPGEPRPGPCKRGSPSGEDCRSAVADFGYPAFEFLPAACRAGAVALLVGFWFDGGLFKLALAAPFWVLIELGQTACPEDGPSKPGHGDLVAKEILP